MSLVIGILLRVWQFTGGAALFVDEIALARNIAERGFSDLLLPLDYGQVAPPAFLLVERALWSMVHADWSLRLVPFACSIASLFLFHAVARRVLRGVAVVLATVAFALGVPFVMYAAQVKPYSSDVAIALGLILLVLQILDDGHEARLPYIGLAGVVSVWFSQGAILVVAGLGAALAILVIRNRVTNGRRVLVIVVLPWALGAVAAGLIARQLVAPATMAYLKYFWADAFVPLPPWSLRDATWPLRTLTAIFGRPGGLGYRFASAYALLAVYGVTTLWRADRHAALVLMAPLAAVVVAGAAQLYPIDGRLVLFLTPVFILSAASGAAAVAEQVAARWPVAGTALLLLVTTPVLERIVRLHPVYHIQPADALLEWLASQRRPGDIVYVWYRAVPNVEWYGPRLGITPDDIRGGCWITEPRRYLKELDRLRGHARVWVVFAGVGMREVRMATDYANAIGVWKGGIISRSPVPLFPPMSVDLYDFSESPARAGVTADRFPITLAPPGKAASIACAAGPVSPRGTHARS